MLSHRKSLAALAAAGAALAISLPAASANAAVDPTVCQLINTTAGPYGPTTVIGGGSLANVLAKAGATVGCAAPAPQSRGARR